MRGRVANYFTIHNEVARAPLAMLAHKEGDDQHLIQRGGRRQTVEVEVQETEWSELISKSSVLIAGAASNEFSLVHSVQSVSTQSVFIDVTLACEE